LEESPNKKPVSKRPSLSNKADAENLGGSTSFPAMKERAGNPTDSEVSRKKGHYPFRSDLLESAKAVPLSHLEVGATNKGFKSTLDISAKKSDSVIDTVAATGKTIAKSFIVRGQIKYSDGKPVPDIKVVAIDRDLRSERSLGEKVTDYQ
jgi:hypothetical protein